MDRKMSKTLGVIKYKYVETSILDPTRVPNRPQMSACFSYNKNG